MMRNLFRSSVMIFILSVTCQGQNRGVDTAGASAFTFQQGQAVYVTAFRRADELIHVNPANNPARGNIERHLYYEHDLAAEKQVRNRIEKWRFFRIVDKASQSDFVFLVHVDSNTLEGIVLPREAYLQLREKFSKDSRIDFELLREEAHQRYLAGPFRISTLGRMSDRLVERFREAVAKAGKGTRK